MSFFKFQVLLYLYFNPKAENQQLFNISSSFVLISREVVQC